MPHSDDIEELDRLIDRAVDTFFVEMASDDEQIDLGEMEAGPPDEADKGTRAPADLGKLPPEPAQDAISFDSFHETDLGDHRIGATSGDADIDRAIDLAVDTLFVEEPEAPPPETTAVEFKPERISAKPPSPDRFKESEDLFGQISEPPASEYIDVEVVTTATTEAETINYEDILSEDVEHRPERAVKDSPQAAAVQPLPAIQPQKAAKKAADVPALRKLQEAILTLEWEISRRSIAVLSEEIQRLRLKFNDDVTVEFACISMRLVLDYVSKRTSRAHPDSIRFLLAVSGLIHRTLTSSNEDPLDAFHQILTRYESFKSVVRKAEGLSDRSSHAVHEVEIKDPDAFSRLVEAQAMTLLKAGKSLAQRLKTSEDSQNLIRSFRFLVTRSTNRILSNTHKETRKTVTGKPRGKH
jgi:hypothetical protein